MIIIKRDSKTWGNIFRNIEENEEIEVTWLDTDNEWCLNVDCELLEDGFKTEKEAQERLKYVKGEWK